MHEIDIRTIQHGSKEYESEVELRRRILRRPLGIDFTAEALAAEKSDIHFGAFSNGSLIGCLVLTPKSGFIKMRQVAVDETVQNMGVGQKLVGASEAWAAAKGYQEIRLSARDTAVTFYKKLSY